jgi:hypothetical protein
MVYLIGASVSRRHRRGDIALKRSCKAHIIKRKLPTFRQFQITGATFPESRLILGNAGFLEDGSDEGRSRDGCSRAREAKNHRLRWIRVAEADRRQAGIACRSHASWMSFGRAS